MSNTLFKNQYFNISRYKKTINKVDKTYDVVHFGPRVGALLVCDEKILLTKQYRYLINSISLEIPGGSVDLGETSYKACQRETLEETGIFPKRLKQIIRYYPGLDNFDNETIIFYSDDFKKKYPYKDIVNNHEIIDYGWYDLTKCFQLIHNGKILDSMTIHAIYWMKNCSK